MVPHLNSVVFYCKTTMWACLSGTTCSHVCSRTSPCFGACYLSSFPENLATLSRRFVLQTFFSRHVVWNILFPTRSESQADMMVGTFPTIAFCSHLAPAIVPFYHGSLPFPVVSKIIHYVVFNKVIHIIQVWVCHSTDPLQTIVVDCLRLVWRVSMIFESKVILFAT